MPDCTYCEDSFATEEASLTHLEDQHADDVGLIDRRRLERRRADDDSGVDPRTLALGALVAGVLAAIVIVLVLRAPGGGHTARAGAARQPTDLWSVHYHGTIEVSIGGERIDFGRPAYQMQADAFHFEGGGGTRWHVHARGVTLGFAMRTLGLNVTADTVTYGGTTYRDAAPGTTVTVLVDGEPVTPRSYVLREGNHIEIRVERS